MVDSTLFIAVTQEGAVGVPSTSPEEIFLLSPRAVRVVVVVAVVVGEEADVGPPLPPTSYVKSMRTLTSWGASSYGMRYVMRALCSRRERCEKVVGRARAKSERKQRILVYCNLYKLKLTTRTMNPDENSIDKQTMKKKKKVRHAQLQHSTPVRTHEVHDAHLQADLS